ncbi:UrcA family protein [Phenylobacterium sp.]|jgi:UrcA family protein|uniref:UrcA family protein n=1 Tax=Phenylobacterium sp. TaxID=1871053 RepID=UPI002F9514B4
MTHFASRIAGVATLALAVLPLAAISTAATAAPAAVKVADIDLNSPHGKAAFEARLERAATNFCSAQRTGVRPLGRAASCREGVREEVVAKLPMVQQAQLARSTYAAR